MPPKRVLFAWIGNTDLRASEGDPAAGQGPIARALAKYPVNEVVLLADQAKGRADSYVRWLRARVKPLVELRRVSLSGPTEYGEIHREAVKAIEATLARHGNATELVFHLSPGTPAMQAIWLLLGKARYPATLIESSPEAGVREVSIPFEISAEFVPDLLKKADAKLERLSEGLPPETTSFKSIVHRCDAMNRVIAQARLVATRSVPVLIEGESGTGKELLARAIHDASPRGARPFIGINCGAIPESLIEAELFGHARGAFTGALSARKGHFREAEGGTLFLDEVGELTAPAQVKLLRVLQEREVVPVGETKAIPIDVRIIAATNRDLLQRVAGGAFRADLYYRLAVGVLRLPPLREREGDISLLVDHLLAQVNAEGALDPHFSTKTLSPAARTELLRHSWPGNVRELLNTLRRLVLWGMAEPLTAAEAKAALPSVQSGPSRLLPARFSETTDLSLEIELEEHAKSRILAVLKEESGNLSRTTKRLGFRNRQTLSNWIRRLKITP